jgi:hypothetical protein
MKPKYSVALAIFCFTLAGGSQAATEENAEDFMGIHNIEIMFHEAGATKNLDLMLSLFADDATLTSRRCTGNYSTGVHHVARTLTPMPAVSSSHCTLDGAFRCASKAASSS